VVLVGPLGLPGIALAIAIAAWIEALALIVILARRLPHFELAGLGRVGLEATAGSVVAGAVAVGVLFGVENVLGQDVGRVLALVELVVVSAAFAAVFAAISLALRIPELPSIVGVMADVLRRPRS
jgi:peptidoglycan biosynthesis protein MviN/MurJ (putative lipid II flippase)